MFYDKEFLGNKFKEYRKNANLTQEALAEKIGIAEKHYGKLERGAFVPSLETFFKLIEVLKIPFSEFGFNLPDYKDDLKEKLAKEIYLLNENELKFYSNIIQSVKEFNKQEKLKQWNPKLKF